MIAPTDISSVRSPVIVESATSATNFAATAQNFVQETLSNLTQNAVGKLFQAQVLSQLEDGSFLVSVADQVFRMALPSGVVVGNRLPMTLQATEPRPVFLLEQQPSGDTSATLSSAAKIINTVLQAAQQTEAPNATVGKVPLLASPTAGAPEIASALKDSVEFSGLFYESHVAQWASGDRPLAELLREPQMQTPPPAGGKAPLAANAAATLQRPPQVTEAEFSKLISDAHIAPAPQRPGEENLHTLAGKSNLPMEADTIVRSEPSTHITQEQARTVNLQLNALEQQRIVWQGELWPGQRMEWEVSEDATADNRHGGAGENPSSWQSVVRFDLPGLGKVTASIHLTDKRLRLQISTASASSAATLHAHAGDLTIALDSAGSPLDSLIIKQDEQS